jgi:hypothetical protein
MLMRARVHNATSMEQTKVIITSPHRAPSLTHKLASTESRAFVA